MSDYSDSKRKGNASLLSSKPKSVTDNDFKDTLETRGVVEADDKEPSNWRELESLVGRGRASAPPEEHEIKSIRVTVRRSSNENSVLSSSRVDTCRTLKEHWNRQWTHSITPYPNHNPKRFQSHWRRAVRKSECEGILGVGKAHEMGQKIVESPLRYLSIELDRCFNSPFTALDLTLCDWPSGT